MLKVIKKTGLNVGIAFAFLFATSMIVAQDKDSLAINTENTKVETVLSAAHGVLDELSDRYIVTPTPIQIGQYQCLPADTKCSVMLSESDLHYDEDNEVWYVLINDVTSFTTGNFTPL